MAKKEEHTGFRNGKLFCFHCGDSHEMNLPSPVETASAMMLAFAKRHAKCLKTWQEPSPAETEKLANTQEKMMWWLEKGERGTSSEVMYSTISGKNIRKDSWPTNPSDPDDFRRCYLLLKAIPEWKDRLDMLRPLSQTWSNLVDNWDKLTEMLEVSMAGATGRAPEMYKLMKDLGC